jgi:GTPase SAR1 family protein
MATYNIAIIGSQGAGKSTLVATFVANHPTLPYEGRISAGIKSKCISMDDKDIKILLWEICCANQISNIDAFKIFHGILICYDITDSSTFETIIHNIRWLSDNFPHIPKILIGTASDLSEGSSEDYDVSVNNLIRNENTGYYDEMKITYRTASRVKKIHAETIASEYNIPFYETSAKNNTNIQESVMDLIHRINLMPKQPENIIAKKINKNISNTCSIQ